MTTAYRVEAHDGNRWSFGIRMDENKRIPVFCGLERADTGTKGEMEALMEAADRLCGGSLRVALVPADA